MRRPKPPSTLDDTAAAKWKELSAELPSVDQGTLDALEQYCTAWSCWLAATDDETKIKWSRCCRQWSQELRLTPKSKRSKAGDRDTGDPLLKLIGGTKHG